MLNKYYKCELEEKIEDIVNDKKVVYEKSDRCKEYTVMVNEALFYGFESILKIITSNKDLYIKLNDKKELSKFIDINREILNQVNKFNINLKLYSKELLSLQEIIVIINYLIENNICTKKNLESILIYFKGEEDAIESFNKLCSNLENIFNKEKSFYKLSSIVFKNEYLKHSDSEEFKKKIIEKITSNKEYIFNNYQLFKIILDFDLKIKIYYKLLIILAIRNGLNNIFLIFMIISL